MGEVTVSVSGSFGEGLSGVAAFSAMPHGHAAAVTEAIALLVGLLPGASALDHRLHSEGMTPDGGWDPAVPGAGPRVTPPGPYIPPPDPDAPIPRETYDFGGAG